MNRKALLKRGLNKSGVDGILITDLLNVRYGAGFTGSSGYLIISKKDSIFVTDFRYQEQAKHEVKGYKVKIEHAERAQEIKHICDSLGIRKLGFEDHSVTFGFYKKLAGKKINLKPLKNFVESLRIMKKPSELARIKTSIQRAESAFRKLRPFIKTGATEQKLALKLEDLLRKEGCKMLPFGVIVASGSMSALPHARPTGRRLKKGDLVVFDWGGECDGYYSDMTRTVLLKGTDISRQKELYYNVLEAQDRAIRSIRPGILAAEIDAAARDYIAEQGYGDFFGHGTGHGVGLAVHEKPVISWRNKERMKDNMVFTVEPGIYLPGLGGVRIEDMVVIRKGRAELLTSLPKRLKIFEG